MANVRWSGCMQCAMIAIAGLISPPALADNSPLSNSPLIQTDNEQSQIPLLTDFPSASINANQLLTQETENPPVIPVIKVTGIKVNSTESGLEIILQTESEATLNPTTQEEGNTFIADISNAVLALPEGEVFQANNPVEGITSITVTQLDATRIRVSVTGKESAPIIEIIPGSGLVMAVTPKEKIEIIVTADRQQGYRVPDASSATRTDTPIRDTPASIQVVPQQVLEEQQATRLEEALRNVSGVTFLGNNSNRSTDFALRGFGNLFTGTPVLQDGFRRYNFQGIPELANIDRVEVLKGPASILYGDIQPGGVISLVSKQPLSEPFYEAELQFGSQELFRPRFDISGPLTSDGSLLYRLNGLYQHAESIQDMDTDKERFFIAPALTWNISPNTDLKVSLNYTHDREPVEYGTLAYRDGVAPISRSFVINEPDDSIERESLNVGYNFEHRFSENWKLRNAFRYSYTSYDYNVTAIALSLDEETGILTRFFAEQEGHEDSYSLQTNMVGNFNTGGIKHTLLFGVDFNRNEESIITLADFENFSPLDIFNPVYGQTPKPDRASLSLLTGSVSSQLNANRVGIYVQDQVYLLDNLILMAGLRYDTVERKRIPKSSTDETTSQSDDAFTPRLGIVYQPIPELSLYASYSQSFTPNQGATVSGSLLEPERGEGYEVGVKAELLDGRLLATLAYFDITKQNVAVNDPNAPPGLSFSIATGEQNSRGIEFDIAGEILPGWNLIASYAYTDAKVTADTDPTLVGDRLAGIPFNSGSLWTTYEIQSGEFQGLGFGVGFNYVGERQGGLPNSFKVGSYFIPNASIFYRRDNWRFALNFKNLSDVKYIESVGNERTSGIFYGAPFSVTGSVSVQF